MSKRIVLSLSRIRFEIELHHLPDRSLVDARYRVDGLKVSQVDFDRILRLAEMGGQFDSHEPDDAADVVIS